MGKPHTKDAALLDLLYGKPAAGDLRNTPMLKRTGEGSYLRQQYPEVYGAGAGLLGIAPDELGGSVLDPNTARVRKAADVTFPIGTAAQIAPLAGPALKGAKMTGKALGAGLNEAIYHGAESPLSKFIPEAVKPLYAVKNKGGGGNVFNVENALKQLKPNAGIDPQDAYELGISNRGDIAIGNWIDTKLTKYIKNELGTENDPVRLLAEKGKLHFDPDVASGRRTRAQQNRRTAGFPEQGFSESQLAVDWEALADSQMQPWMSGGPDVPAGAQAYKFGTSFQTSKVLGFDHIIDELRNATTLGDNLPKVLQIDPKKLEQMSVSDVVNHVSKINEWRANQAARSHDAAIKALEKSPVTSVVKEYPDGYKWVELKLPDTVQDITSLIRKDGDVFEIYEPGQTLSWKDPSTGKIGWKSPEDATAAYSKSKNYGELEKALELEGSSMGHCVGGYCPAVAEGKVRIFSLRDPKGRAHATIEVEPPASPREGTIGQEELPPEVFADLKRRNVLDDNIRWKFDDTTGRYMPQLGPFEPSIHQIKGKGNARPIEKYDPYTQDFIQGNDWHIVEEAHNAGLRDTSYELGTTLQYAEDLGLKLPRFVSDKDYRQLIQHMDETIETGIPREVPEVLKKYAPVEPKPASPYLQETLPAAEADANLAKYLEESAEKERWYTGTSSDVQEFNPALGLEKPGQAGATFASKNPDFSSVFARDAHLSNPNLERQLTPEKIELAKKNAEQYFRDTYPDMPEHADEMIRSIQAGKPVGEAEDALKDAYRELMPAGPNIMPVYVRTTNPFDFANPEHVASLKAIYPELPVLNRTSTLELPEVQDAIKKAGFDAFYTAEGGNRNIGLFQPTQLKSAIGNQGTYDVTNPLISKKDGGLVSTPDDFTTPDMSDSSKFFTDPDFARFVMEQPR